MEPSLKFVLFDCEGTLADTYYMNIAILEETFARFQRPCPDRALLRSVMMLPFSVMFEKLGFKGYELGDICTIARQVTEDLRYSHRIAQPAYDGIPEMLARLEEAGYLMGIATGRSRRSLEHWLQQQKLENYFVTLQTPDTCRSKPHPEMTFAAMDMVGAEPENTVVIGDTSYDILMAKDARAPSIGVTWGLDSAANLTQSGAHEIAHKAEELPRLIEKLIGKAA